MTGTERWVRFHALPQSKRYAETPEERDIILDRANTIARAVVGEGEACWLVQAGDWAPVWRHDPPLLTTGAYTYDDQIWPAHCALTKFHSNAFNDLIDDIANERALRTLWMNGQTGNVFAPYDGGFDVFLGEAREAELLKTRHSSWLSTEPSGF